ncbi:MAG: hypothetical protein CL663_08615 [Bacteroidetes bacterium]|nr:hypothetical protein [Bacteroidota bacterium]
MKRILFTIALSLTLTLSFAQGAIDALRFSTTTFNGDARYMGMSGAFGALGANTSVMSTNPAGLGLYQRSDFSISTSFVDTKVESTYNSSFASDSRFNFSFNNLAVVFSNDYLNIRPSGYWKNFQVGIGFNQIKNFNNRTLIRGNNTSNSIADMYAEIAEGIHWEDIENDLSGNYAFDLNPAWWSFMFSQDGTATSSFVGHDPAGGVLQTKLIESWGYLNEFSLAFSASYADRIYIGASLGMPVLNFHQRVTYQEDALESTISTDAYRTALVQDYLDTEGLGVNLKLGMIYRPNDMFRFGFALHTPTYYPGLNDQWSKVITTEWDIHETSQNSSPLGNFAYDLSTPMRLIGSVAFIIGKFGLISADYEYVDYSTAKFSASGYSFIDENSEIKNFYTNTTNIRLGTEWRVMNFAVRGGFAYYGSPFADNGNDASIKSYSLGTGYKERNFYMDLAWVYSDKTEDQYLYGFGAVATNAASSNTMISNFTFTVGFRF